MILRRETPNFEEEIKLAFFLSYIIVYCIICVYYQDDIEEDDMREFFAQFGTITDIVRMTDKATGKQIDL